METLYAIQWLNPQTELYETCQSIDCSGQEVAAIYFDKEYAQEELEVWSDSGECYRMAEVMVTTV